LGEVVAAAMYNSKTNAEQKRDVWKSEMLAEYLEKGEVILTFIKEDVPNSIEIRDGNDCANKATNLK
jgi:hypothetical protein